ncbi:response regulator transcription factor [Bacillus alkalicellulosilyticus]|uniref:response regulator transcription factor n=1 Tax=Alkalihalobacterium alkalicellulosilyticum TaxID=1912214 RepID=UPI000997C750|nr:response regulator [Bacillus alkalicellulosilyticus]
MTIRMLIVDDEPVICQGLASTLPWSTLEIEVVGTAYDGKQALQMMESEQIDLILTDVCMPEIDGIGLTKQVTSLYPQTKIIMISGHDEFQYARQALRLGVEDYLLKPVDIDELLELVKRVSTDIVLQKKQDNLLKEDILSQAVLHFLFKAPIYIEQEKINDIISTNFRVIVSSIFEFHQLESMYTDEEIEIVKEEWKTRIGLGLAEANVRFFSIFGHKNELITVCYSDDSRNLAEALIRIVCEGLSDWKHPLQLRVSNIHSQLDEIVAVYQEVTEVMVKGYKQSVLFTSERMVEQQKISYPKEQELKLREAILNQNKGEVIVIVTDLFHDFQTKGLDLSQVLHITRELVVIIKNRLQEMMSAKALQDVKLNIQEKIDLKVYNTHKSIEQLVGSDLLAIMKAIEKKDNNHWIIENAQKYIRENFQKDIKASEVAEHHFITPNYFSMLFKQETGQSFSEYLNRLRIEKAADLLSRTSNKVFEISEYVGYKEYKYFVQIFKKHMGVTPTQYRRLNTTKIK